MTILEQLFSEEFIYALGWTVVHSLWQGILVALVLAFFLHRFRGRSAKLRYEIAAFALFSMFIFAMSSFIYLYDSIQHHSSESLQHFISTTAAQLSEHSLLQASVESSISYFNEHLSLFVSLWFIGALFFLFRLLAAYGYVQKIKHHPNQAISMYWQRKFEQLLEKTPIKKSIQLAESAIVKTPMVIGYFKPIILMPLGAINQLSTAEVESILAHEIAHIYRNDYLINIIQSLIEILFYFNPAVWWISANVRIERENCCDDIAIKLCGNSLTYAKALVKLQEMNQGIPQLAMPLSRNREHLLNRIKRILNQPQNKSNVMEKITASCCLLIAVCFLSFNSGKIFQQQDNIPLNQETDAISLHTTIKVTPEEIGPVHTKKIPLLITKRDTLIPAPKRKKERSKFRHSSEGKDIRVEMEDGEIQSLEINGEEIPEEDFADYENVIVELMENTPPPPPPPPAPPFPSMNRTPPSPPAPPAPPSFFRKRKKLKIQKQKDEGGNQVIILNGNDLDSPLEIKVEDDNLFINGEKLEEGEDFILENDSNFNFHFNEDGKNNFKGLFFKDGDQGFHFQLDSLNNHIHSNEDFLKFYEKNALKNKELLEHLEKNKLLFKSLNEEKTVRLKELLHAKELKNHCNDVIIKDKLAVFPRGNLFIENSHKAPHFNQFIPILERELLNDGLIDNTKRYKLKLTERRMKVNGKKQSKEVLKKYHRLYKSATGQDISDSFEIHIIKKGKKTETSISR